MHNALQSGDINLSDRKKQIYENVVHENAIRHPHSQLVMTPIVTHEMQWREYEALRYYNEQGSNVYLDMLEAELEDKKRVIVQNPACTAKGSKSSWSLVLLSNNL